MLLRLFSKLIEEFFVFKLYCYYANLVYFKPPQELCNYLLSSLKQRDPLLVTLISQTMFGSY